MKPATDILDRARAAGVQLYASGDRIMAKPSGALSDELRALIRANRAALLNALREADVVDVAHVAGLAAKGGEAGQVKQDRPMPRLERPSAAVYTMSSCHFRVTTSEDQNTGDELASVEIGRPEGHVVEYTLRAEHIDPLLLHNMEMHGWKAH